MKKPKVPKPTESELGILRVLWEKGPSSVRDVWEVLNSTAETGYTTVLKIMQIMFEKGLVKRDESNRSHVYSVALSEEQTQRQVLRHLLDRVFSGSAPKLVMQALAVKKATREELAAIRKLLDELEEGQK